MMVVIALGVYFVDWSRILMDEELKAVRQFVIGTHSEPVAKAYNQALNDQQMTENELSTLLEIAKEQAPGRGLIAE